MNILSTRVWLPLLLAVFAASPAFSAPDDESRDTDWTVPAAGPKPPAPGGPAQAPSTSEGNYSSSDQTGFGERFRARILLSLCQRVALKRNISLGGDFSGTGIEPSRSLATYNNGELALVDQEKVTAAWGHAFGRAEGATSEGLFLGVRVEGDSVVVRPLHSKASCDQVKRIVDVSDVKTILPFTAERIAAMDVGELWRLPLTLTYSQAASVGRALADDASVSVSFGRGDTGTSSLTLYRVSPEQTRFRFRIDHVVVKSKSASVSLTFPAAQFAHQAHNVLLRFMENQTQKQFERYTSAWLNYGVADSDGKRVLLEFVADARDPKQAEALEKALKGDFMDLLLMARHMTALEVTDESTLAAFEKQRAQNTGLLGEAKYDAVSEYAARVRSFGIGLPVLIAHTQSELFGEDKVTRVNGATGQFQYYRSDKSGSSDYFNMPFLGPISKHSDQRDAEAVTFAADGKTHGDPILVYIENHGYMRLPASLVKEDVDSINAVLRLTGARRGADGDRLRLPTDKVVPPPTLARGPSADAASGPNTQEVSDRKGMISFTLVMNQNAVRDSVSGTAEQIAKAYAAAAHRDDQSMMAWLSANGRFEDGKLRFDERAGRAAFEPYYQGRDAYADLTTLSGQTAALVADIASVRNAPDNQARAKALAKILGGGGESKLSYDKMLRVLVQFMDPLDVTGDFVANVQTTTKGGKDTSAHLILKQGRSEVPTLQEAGATKGRFAQPSILTD